MNNKKKLSRAKKDLEIENEEKNRIWKDTELKAMREDEKRRLEEKFASFTRTMEDKIKIKLKNFTDTHENSKSEIKSLVAFLPSFLEFRSEANNLVALSVFHFLNSDLRSELSCFSIFHR